MSEAKLWIQLQCLGRRVELRAVVLAHQHGTPVLVAERSVGNSVALLVAGQILINNCKRSLDRSNIDAVHNIFSPLLRQSCCLHCREATCCSFRKEEAL